MTTKAPARLPAALGKHVRSLRAVLKAQSPRPIVTAKQRQRDAAILADAAGIIARYASELPVNVEWDVLLRELETARQSIATEGPARGGQANPALQTLIYGLATNFHRYGLRITVSRDGLADRVLRLLLPEATGRAAAGWDTRRTYLRAARQFQRQLPPALALPRT